MNSGDFLAIAEEFAAMDREAAWRSATSRAYYAVLHTLIEQSRGRVLPEKGCHKAATDLLDELHFEGRHDFAELQDLRVESDYLLDVEIRQAKANWAIQAAKGLLPQIRERFL
jgi:hypothetical protein